MATSAERPSKSKSPALPTEAVGLRPAPHQWQVWVVAATLAVAAFVCYLPSLGGEFLNWDDGPYVTDNLHVRAGLTWETVVWAFASIEHSNWHPLTWLSHAADVSLYGYREARGHHTTNVVLHSLNAALVVLVLWRLTRRLWPSAIVAALFALHPLHVESVSWIAERKDVLSTFFLLLTLWAYVAYVAHPVVWRYALVVAAFAASLMSKPMAVTLPFVLLVLDYWPLARLSWRAVMEKLPLLALTVASCVITYCAQSAGGAVRPADQLAGADRLLHAVYAYAMYLAKAAWPWPGTLLPYYPLPDRGGDPISIDVAVMLLAGLAIATVLLWSWRRRRPYMLAGWLIYLGMLVPVIGLVQVGKQVMADRYTYVPLIGVFIAVVWLVTDLIERRSRKVRAVAMAAAVLVCGTLGWLTWRQQATWKNPVSLWSGVADAYPRSSHALMQLGHAHYLLTHELDPARKNEIERHRQQSLECYRRAVDVESMDYLAAGNLANSLMAAEDLEGAERYFRKALALKETHAPTHNGLGSLLFKQKRFDEALVEFRRALELNPDYFPTYLNLAAIALLQKNYPEAERLSRDTVRRWPELVKAWEYLAMALDAQGKREEAAIAHAKAADPTLKRVREIPIDK